MEATRQIVLSSLSLLLCTAFATDVDYGQQQKAAKAKLNALEMKSVPDGHFLVKLQVGGQERLLNIESKNDSAKCVTTDNPKLKGLRGRFQLIGNGVFLVFFQNENHRASQYWVFREDGGATIKEIPDRGEDQEAVPVDDDSIEPRKK